MKSLIKYLIILESSIIISIVVTVFLNWLFPNYFDKGYTGCGVAYGCIAGMVFVELQHIFES